MERAKQGDPDAISELINRSLSPKGITVSATLSRDFLTILAESATVPDQQAVTQFIDKGIKSLNPQGIERIVIKGKAQDQKNAAWRQVMELGRGAAVSNSETATSQTQKGQPSIPVLNWLKGARDLVNTGLLAGILLTLLLGGRFFSSNNSTYWEYKVEGIEDETFELSMQELGAQGWEVSSARRAVTGEGDFSRGLYEVILKRPVSAGQARRNLREAEKAQEALALENTQRLAELRLSTVLRAQQTHLLLEDTLASSFEELDLGSMEDNESYTFSLNRLDARTAQVTATAQQPGLKSFIGAVFVTGSSTKKILCSSEAATQEVPPAPTLVGNQPQCAEGSQPVD